MVAVSDLLIRQKEGGGGEPLTGIAVRATALEGDTDRAHDLGGFLVTQDATRYDEGVAMRDVMALANKSAVWEIVIILDCCHSGSLGKIPGIENDHAVLREGASVLTASRASQVSLEVGGRGDFTSLVCEALKGALPTSLVAYPVVLKVVSPQVSHKSDVGGVRVGLRDAASVRSAYREMLASVLRCVPDAQVTGVLVQCMVPDGEPELIAGFSRVEGFGPMLMVGLGGIYVEALRDVQLRLAPVDHHDALEMLRTLRSARLLGPFRGAPAVDVSAVADVLVRLGDMAHAFPEIAELDVNPLRVGAHGALALDARVVMRASQGRDAQARPYFSD